MKKSCFFIFIFYFKTEFFNIVNEEPEIFEISTDENQ